MHNDSWGAGDGFENNFWKVNINMTRINNQLDGVGGREVNCQELFPAWGPG